MEFPAEDNENISSLKVHEWLAIAILIGILSGLACLTSLNAKGESGRSAIEIHHNKYSGFDVLVKGAVDHPGVYHINSEITMKDLLSLAGLSSSSDLRRFNLDAVIKKGRVVNVPLRAMINIRLAGAVKEERTLSIPKGSKLEDLVAIAELAPNANVKALMKKRRLKDDEIVIVPFLN
ncbi:MAG TPA: SLBB domain-containing protein [Parachlamydiaceae bacterium]|nr:SLBB domain-containing protein [Parachlamydiaceae bacterium]